MVNPWEPEEFIGSIWHRFVEKLDETPRYPDAAVALEDMRGRIGILFHGLGGDHGVNLVPAVVEESSYRLSFKRRLGRDTEAETRATFDGEELALPATIDTFPDIALNEKLFLWVSAWCAHAQAAPSRHNDPIQTDIAALTHAMAVTEATLTTCPGLRSSYDKLCENALALRMERRLPKHETAVEAAIVALLGGPVPTTQLAKDILETIRAGGDLGKFESPLDYQPYRPVPLWPERRPLRERSGKSNRDDGDSAGAKNSESDQKQRRRAKRRESDQADRKDSLLLNRFETILSWAEFLNINRAVDDDDEESAKKAAEDHEEIGIGEVEKRPQTKLAFDLDLAPEDVERERLAGEWLYPEWDYRANDYLPDHCRVLTSQAEAAETAPAFLSKPATRRRIRAVRKRFEALKPKRVSLPRQPDGDDLDMDAVVRSWVDLNATGEGSDRIYRAIRNEARDLAVAILVDTSRSTESVVDDRPVIDIARESLIAFTHGLTSVGDDHAIYAFSSLKRNRVYVSRCKGFDETLGPGVEARIAALKPGFYTRLGAAIRHVSSELAERASQRRLLLILTDGKPNDLDHYDGRYGLEDTRRAVMEARRLGQAVFAVTIDKRARDYVSHVFGRNGHAIVPKPSKLTQALPLLYQHLVA